MGGGLERAIDLLSFIFVIGVGIGHAFGTKMETIQLHALATDVSVVDG